MTLDNGVRLTVCTLPHLRSVSLMVFVGAGSRYETQVEAGVSHFIEHLYFKGTDRHPTSKEISEAIENIGGALNGGTDKEMTTYWCKVADEHYPVAVDLLADLLLRSRLEPADIEKERQIIIEEINMSLDQPQFRVDLLVDQLIWSGQPLGRDVAGTKETVAAMTRRQMTDFVARRYRARNGVIAITGAITPEAARESIERAFAAWPRGGVAAPVPTVERQNRAQMAVETRDCEQAHICLGVPAVSMFDRDRFPVLLLSIILGEGMSSRLFLEIREKRGLAYDIRSHPSQHLDTGSLVIYAGVDPKNAATAVAAIVEQLALIKEGVPELELNKAQEIAKGRLLLRLEDSGAVAAFMGAQELLTNKIMTVDEVVAQIKAVTADDVKRVARKLLVTEKLNLAIVGPVKGKAALRRLLKL